MEILGAFCSSSTELVSIIGPACEKKALAVCLIALCPCCPCCPFRVSYVDFMRKSKIALAQKSGKSKYLSNHNGNSYSFGSFGSIELVSFHNWTRIRKKVHCCLLNGTMSLSSLLSFLCILC